MRTQPEELAVAARESSLENSCADDTTLRMELRRLLAANAEMDRREPAAPPAEPAEVPERVGRYRLQRLLGRGGFGHVYLGHDEQLQREVAVKIPRLDRLITPDAFLNEARNLAPLAHPHIVTIFDYGQTAQGICYAVYEFVPGESLAARIARAATKQHDAARLVAKIARALAHVHAHGIYHRDIKPDNILLDKDGQPRLADFGLAMSERQWQDDVPISGTPNYMSPEQARGDADIDGRSDLFSLGAVLYELLTRHKPFEGDSIRDTMTRVQTKTPKPPREYDASISPELQRICLRALEKERSNRHQTATDLAEELERFLENTTRGEATGSTKRNGRDTVANTVTSRRSAGVSKSDGSKGSDTPSPMWRPLLIFSSVAIAPLLAVVMLVQPGIFGESDANGPSDLSVADAAATEHLHHANTTTRKANTIRIGVKPWVGYSPLAVAQAMQLCDGVDIQFVPIDNLEQAQRALDRDEIDVGMWLVDTHAQARAKGVPTKVVLKIDVSQAADGVVARDNIKSFKDLVGKRVAFQQEDASHYLMLALCERYGVDIDDIEAVIVETPAVAAERFLTGVGDQRVDAAVTYFPHLQDAVYLTGADPSLEREGAHLLASAADVPDTIVDVLTVEESYLENHSENVEALIRGWFAAVRILSDPSHPKHQGAVAIACAFNGKPGGADWRVSHPCTPDEYHEMAAGMAYGDEDANRQFFRREAGQPSRYDESFQRGQEVWFSLGRLSRKTEPRDGDGSGITLRVLSGL